MSTAPTESDPLFNSDRTIESMTDQICAIPLQQPTPRWWIVALVLSLVGVLLLLAASIWLFFAGVGVWGVDWPVAWGFALINYVWWIAIASGGTFISALFYLTGAKWRNSISRLAETMTVFAVACAAIFPILHLGRPWLFYWLFPYPNTMTLWPQFRSPLLWDFFAILTYAASSVLFWYYGLIPDLATMRDKADTPLRRAIYGVFAAGFRGSATQWREYRTAYAILAVIMAPLVVSVHSIVGLDFAGAATVGWHSTQFPPFFVFGALLSGFAMTLLLIIPLRRFLGLEDFITGRHFDALGKLLLASSLWLAYAYLMDAFTSFYTFDAAERAVFLDKIAGSWAFVYWGAIIFNVVIPQIMWRRRFRTRETAVAVVSIGGIIGMWLERYQIVVMSLRRPRIPSAWGEYAPTFWDWSTFLGAVGLFVFGIVCAVRFVPILSMFEMREVMAAARTERRNGSG